MPVNIADRLAPDGTWDVTGDIGTGRACPLCPGISDINLFRYCQGVIHFDAQVSDRAFDLGMPEQCNGSHPSPNEDAKIIARHMLETGTGRAAAVHELCGGTVVGLTLRMNKFYAMYLLSR